MTIITMSTVGYGEVHLLDMHGRTLSIIIIIATLVVGGYAFGNIGAFLIGGEVGAILKGRKMERSIGRLNKHVILIGYGAVGSEAASACTGAKLIIIEKDQTRLDKALEHGYMAILGDATQEDVLHQVGIEKASGMMIAIGVVADTILISLTAKEINPDLNISARIDDVHAVSKIRRVGVNNIVMLSQIGGRRLAAFIRQPAIVDFLDLVMKRDDLSLKLEQIRISAGSVLEGKTLQESHIRKVTHGATVMSVLQPDGKQITAPQPDYKIQAGDILIALGNDDSLMNLGKMAEKKE